MTYAELFQWAECLTEDEMKQDVTIYNAAYDEYYPVKALNFAAGKQDVLDRGHPVLEMTDE